MPSALDKPERPDVFISYSREDEHFAERLSAALEESGRDVWMDREDIRAGAEWWTKIEEGLEASRAVVPVLSPDFVRSNVCGQEIERALALNKRLVPVMRAEVKRDDVTERVGALNWIYFRDTDDFDAALSKLVEAAETDQEWLDRHARLNVRAGEWQRSGRNASFLLSGADLKESEHWLAEQGSHKETASELQQEFILASRGRETRRMRTILIAVLVALAISLALGALAWYQRDQAIARERVAQSRALAVTAAAQLRVDPERSLLLALAAADAAKTPQAIAAVRRGLAATRITARLDPRGVVEPVAFRRRGRELVTAGGSTQAWDLSTGRQLPAPPTLQRRRRWWCPMHWSVRPGSPSDRRRARPVV